MDNKNILTETTLKLKTKILIFSGISLFIGLTKTLPTKLSLIGLDFEHSTKIFGWFLIAITIFLFIHFLIMVSLDITKYCKKSIIKKKATMLTGDTIGLTYKEIGEEYSRQEGYENYQDERGASLGSEAEDIHKKIKILQDDFDNKHLKFYNMVELVFNALLPTVLAILGLKYLFCFLI